MSSSDDPFANGSPPQALHLLNALYAFYQHERSWVHRTRASLELALVQGPLAFDPPPPPPRDEEDEAMGQVKDEEEEELERRRDKEEECDDEETPSSSSEGTSSNEPSAAPTDASDLSTASSSTSTSSTSSIKPEPSSPPLFPSRLKARRTALTSVQPTPDSRWLRRKKSFRLSLGTLSQRPPERPRLVLPLRPSASGNQPSSSSPSFSYSYPQFDGCAVQQQQQQQQPTPPAQEVEPSAQLLQLFGELVESRLESCVRVSRLLQDSGSTMQVQQPPW